MGHALGTWNLSAALGWVLCLLLPWLCRVTTAALPTRGGLVTGE